MLKQSIVFTFISSMRWCDVLHHQIHVNINHNSVNHNDFMSKAILKCHIIENWMLNTWLNCAIWYFTYYCCCWCCFCVGVNTFNHSKSTSCLPENCINLNRVFLSINLGLKPFQRNIHFAKLIATSLQKMIRKWGSANVYNNVNIKICAFFSVNIGPSQNSIENLSMFTLKCFNRITYTNSHTNFILFIKQ